MKETFLDIILRTTRDRVEAVRSSADIAGLKMKAEERRGVRPANAFRRVLQQSDGINIIAEIKRASPSKGIINDHIDVRETARTYKAGGASAISVLTEEQYFKGSLDDLKAVREVVDLPILRKDFIIDPFQIYEAATAGADAILLIVAALTFEDLLDLQTLARELGLDALVEVHSLAELEIAGKVGADLIGVNNRNLHTFKVSFDVSRELVKEKPAGTVMIAESGITSRGEIEELRLLGYDGFLVGESLMRASGSAAKLMELVA